MNIPRSAVLAATLLASVPAMAQHGPSPPPRRASRWARPAARSVSSRWMPAGSPAASTFRSRSARHR